MNAECESLSDWLRCSCAECRADRAIAFDQEEIVEHEDCPACSAVSLLKRAIELASEPKVPRTKLKSLLRESLEIVDELHCDLEDDLDAILEV